MITPLLTEVEEYLNDLLKRSARAVSHQTTWAGGLLCLLISRKLLLASKNLPVSDAIEEMREELKEFFAEEVKKQNGKALPILRKLEKTGQEIVHAP